LVFLAAWLIYDAITHPDDFMRGFKDAMTIDKK